MSYRNQKKYFETLKRFERKMEPKEREKYSMLVKRDKDDEYLDKESMQFLKELYEKYYVNRTKPNYEDIFKKPEDKN